jgi:hypothetical protein
MTGEPSVAKRVVKFFFKGRFLANETTGLILSRELTKLTFLSFGHNPDKTLDNNLKTR